MEQERQTRNRNAYATDIDVSPVRILLSLGGRDKSLFNPQHYDKLDLPSEFDAKVFNFLWGYKGRLKPEDFVDATEKIAQKIVKGDRDTRKTLMSSVLCGHNGIAGLHEFGHKVDELYFGNYF